MNNNLSRGQAPVIGSFQLDDIAPASGGVLALEVMFDGISEDIGPDLRSSLLTLGRAQASLALLSLNQFHIILYICWQR